MMTSCFSLACITRHMTPGLFAAARTLSRWREALLRATGPLAVRHAMLTEDLAVAKSNKNRALRRALRRRSRALRPATTHLRVSAPLQRA